MAITKKVFDAQLKAGAGANGFQVQGNYLVFDNTANLEYVVIPGYKLRDLLTKNPVASYTKLNKDLILRLAAIAELLGACPVVLSSYRSNEYNLTVIGSKRSSKHCTGDALDLGFNDVDALVRAVDSMELTGERGAYAWGVHIAVSQSSDLWDKRPDDSFLRKVLNFIEPDSRRNFVYYGLLGVGAFIFIKKLFT